MMSLSRETGGTLPAEFIVGDVVDVLNASRLPKVEEVRYRATVVRACDDATGDRVYWLDDMGCAKSASRLRLVLRTRTRDGRLL